MTSIRAEVAASGKMAWPLLSFRSACARASPSKFANSYPHLAGYLADVEGVRVYKQGRENWVAGAITEPDVKIYGAEPANYLLLVTCRQIMACDEGC